MSSLLIMLMFESKKIYIYFPGTAHGNRTEWLEWTMCSVTCGGGVQSRNRTCNNAPPAYGGRGCDKDSHETKSCNTAHCPGGVMNDAT